MLNSKFFSVCASEIAPMLADFYQQYIDEGQVPDDWTKENVAPIFKKGITLTPFKLSAHITHKYPL